MPSALPGDVARVAAAARAELSGRVLAVTLRRFRDPDVAEEATADAFLSALQTWPETGIPDSVEGWLITVARRKALDRIRRDQLGRRMATRMGGTAPLTAAAGRRQGGGRGDR